MVPLLIDYPVVWRKQYYVLPPEVVFLKPIIKLLLPEVVLCTSDGCSIFEAYHNTTSPEVVFHNTTSPEVVLCTLSHYQRIREAVFDYSITRSLETNRQKIIHQIENLKVNVMQCLHPTGVELDLGAANIQSRKRKV